MSGTIKIIKEFPVGEPIVSMIQYKEWVLVATTKRIVKMYNDDHFEQLTFVEIPPEPKT